MDKLNIFDGYLSLKPGTEDRLTWALMNLIRMSPIIRAAFLDLVRDKQEQPIPALTTLRERKCVVQTQVGTLVAQEGRLVAIGITAEGKDVDDDVQSEDRGARYDGVVTFIAPENRHRVDQQESLTLTIESKRGSEVEPWQLRPSKASLGCRKIKTERSLAQYDLVALFIDGKTFAEYEMIIALGVTIEGHKIPLGFVQAATENERVCRQFIQSLINRDLVYHKGLLCLIDGSKGLYAALTKALDGYVVIQRCQWHKRENVISYLPKGKQDEIKKTLQNAYDLPIKVDRQAVILAWRDIVSTLTDIELRELVSPAERAFIRDFIDYVAAYVAFKAQSIRSIRGM